MHCRRISIILILILSIATSARAFVLTLEEKAYLAEKGEIVFIGQTHYPPFEFKDKNKGYVGMTIDVVNWIATETGFIDTYQDSSFSRAQAAVLDGKVDVLTSFFYSEKRDSLFDFSAKLFDIPASIYVAVDRTDIKDAWDLAGKTIAMQYGDYAAEYLETEKIHATFIGCKNFAEATDKVLSGEADAVIGDEQIVNYHLYSHNLEDRVKIVGEPLYVGQLCMAVKEGNTVLLSILNKGINQAYQTGTIAKIENKWLGATLPSSSQTKWLDNLPYLLAALIISLCLAMGIWYWNFLLRREIAKRTVELKLSNQSLQQSKERYRLMVENQTDLLVKVDFNNRFLFVSPSYCALFGKREDELLGKTFIPLIHPDDQKTTLKEMEKLMQPPYHCTVEQRAMTVLGWRWLHWVDTAVRNNDGIITAIIGVGRDVTERKEAEAKLSDSEEHYRSIFNNAPLGIFHYNLEGVIIRCNDRFAEILGSSVDKLTNFNMLKYVKNEQVLACIHQTIAGKVSRYEGDYLSITGGKLSTVRIYFSPIRTEKGELVSAVGIVEDISEWKRAELALKKNEEQLKYSLEATNDGLWDRDLITGGAYFSPRFYTMCGYRPNEFVANHENWLERIHKEDRERCVQLFNDTLSGISSQFEAEYRFLCKDGTYKWILGRGKVFEYDENGRPKRMVGTHVDITDRWRAEAALQQEKERLAVTLRAIGDGVISTDTFGSILLLNKVAEEYTGWPQQEAINRPLSEVLDLRTAKQNHNVENPVVTVLTTGQLALEPDDEWIMINRHGESKYIDVVGAPIRNNKGTIIGVVLVIRDITLSRELEQAKSNFLNAISHELRTPLTPIIGYAEMLMEEHLLWDERTQFLNQIISSARREQKLVEELLMIARLENSTNLAYEFMEYNVFELFQSLKDNLKILVKKTVENRYGHENYKFSAFCAPNLLHCNVRVDLQAIQQVLENLLINAVKYSPPDRVDVRLDFRRDENNLVVSVTDRGFGIPETEKDKIFLPFHQIRRGKLDASDGIGHGLAIVKRHVLNHHGSIQLTRSSLDEGSQFDICLPFVGSLPSADND